MQCEKTVDIRVMSISCSDNDRHLPPTRGAIEVMKKSLKDHGQINPISVYPVTHSTYRLIAGATRFRAASEMNWQKIRASIWSGTDIDYQIHELSENVDRRELTADQRREMRAKIKELQRQRLASVERAKGGRGHKGGVSEAARQEGVPRTTARRRQREEQKGGHKEENGHVSEPASPPSPPAPRPASAFAVKKYTVDIPMPEFLRISAHSDRQHISVADAMRRAVRAYNDSCDAANNSNVVHMPARA